MCAEKSIVSLLLQDSGFTQVLRKCATVGYVCNVPMIVQGLEYLGSFADPLAVQKAAARCQYHWVSASYPNRACKARRMLCARYC